MASPKTMDDILNMPVESLSFKGVGQRVVKDNYHQLVALPNVTSYSMQQTFHGCPKKFELAKLRAATNAPETREANVTFAFGHAVGAGVAKYDETLDIREAIWEAFIAWDVDLLEVEEKHGKKTGKSIHEAIWALYVWKQFHAEETDLGEFAVVQAEATMVVDFEDGHYYIGHIDELLQHEATGRLRVKENKTTAMVNIDTASYSNSDQGLSYSILADMLGETEYEVLYTVYSTAEREWRQFSFVKSAAKKAEWIQDQLLQHAQQDQYSELKFFPKRGNNCMAYNRRCPEYELCDINSKLRFGMHFEEIPRVTSIEEINAIETIHYSTTLSEIVARQQARLARKES
jgi:hypothetical protein